jgi:hypothetical protein
MVEQDMLADMVMRANISISNVTVVPVWLDAFDSAGF